MTGWVPNAPCRVTLSITPWVAFVPICCVKTAACLGGESRGDVAVQWQAACGSAPSLPVGPGQGADSADLLTTGTAPRRVQEVPEQ